MTLKLNCSLYNSEQTLFIRCLIIKRHFFVILQGILLHHMVYDPHLPGSFYFFCSKIFEISTSPPMTIQITSNKKICEIYFFLSNRRQFKKNENVRNVVPYFHVRYDFWIKTMFVLYLSPVD